MSDQDDFMREVEAAGGVLVVRGGLNVLRRARLLAREDGRNFEDLSSEAMDRYVELAKSDQFTRSDSDAK